LLSVFSFFGFTILLHSFKTLLTSPAYRITMNAHFPKLPSSPTKKGFREMQIYEIVRQAADAWNIPLDQVAIFQEWWDSGKKGRNIPKVIEQYNALFQEYQPKNEFSHRLSQYYKQHDSYVFPEDSVAPSIINLLDIAQYYLSNPDITVPNFVLHLSLGQLDDISELGESVLVLTGGEENTQGKVLPKKTRRKRSLLLNYLRKIQLLVKEMQIVSTKSLPDLYIFGTLSLRLSEISVKCRNLILAKKVKIHGIHFIANHFGQLQLHGGI